MPRKYTKTPIIDRMMRRIEKQGDHWIWIGEMSSRKTPRFSINSRSNYPAMRMLYKILIGPVDELRNFRNKCGVDRCVNPHHWSGAQKLDHEEIKELWRLSELHKTTMQKLGDKYGVSKQRIEQIINDSKI